MKAILSIATFLSAVSLISHAQTAFDQSSYFKECGGKAYPKCDTEKVNQKTMWDEAFTLAQRTNRTLITIVGADWCPGCLILDKTLKSASLEVKQKIDKNFLIVKISSDAKSGKKLIEDKKWEVPALPTLLLVAPKTQEARRAAVDHTLEASEILSQLETIASGKAIVKNYDWFPSKDIGTKGQQNRVRLELLKKPIGLDANVLSLVNAPSKSGLSTKNQEAAKYYNQALYYHFLFNWIDAVRSARIAIEKDPTFVEAYFLLSEAYTKLGAYDSTIGALLQADKAASQVKVSKALRTLLDSRKQYYCYYSDELCTLFKLKGETNAETRNEKANQLAVSTLEAIYNEDEMNLALLHDFDSMTPGLSEYLVKVVPNHVGARHLLVHIYENADKYEDAATHAAVLAKLAPNSAHAQHMYGHILPKVNKWKEAIVQFEKANRIHQAWMKENKSNEEEDWHYRHNLDLLSHAYNWEKQYSKAETGWEKLCDAFQGHYCDSYVTFLLNQNKIRKAEEVIAQYKLDNELRSAVINFLKVNSYETATALMEAGKKYYDESPHAYILYYMMYLKHPQIEKQKLEDYIGETVKQAGFDSWSVAVLNAELYSKIAEKMDEKSFAANIRLIIASVGFVCKATKK